MQKLQNLLCDEGYQKVGITITETKHIVIKLLVNNVIGNFIVDTGASDSCISSESCERFDIISEESEIQLTGAASSGITTTIAKGNLIQISDWVALNQSLVVIDLKHINEAVNFKKFDTIHGILGADLLQMGSSIIDYKEHFLYIK